MLNMKYTKLLFLPLLFGCALAQQTPINNPYITGTVTFSTTPSVTNNMMYVDGSNHLQSLKIGSGLTLTSGILSANASGNTGNSAQFTTLSVGTEVATSAQPIDFTPTVTANAGSGKEMRLSGQLNVVADNDSLFGIAMGGSISAIASHANVNYIKLDLGATTLAGYANLNSATMLYINQSPAATNRYGIVQAGSSDTNTFSGPTQFTNTVSLQGSITSNSSGLTFGDGSSLYSGIGYTFASPTTFTSTSASPYNNIFSGTTVFATHTYLLDPSIGVSNSPILRVSNPTGQITSVTIGSGLNYSAGTLSTTGGGVYCTASGSSQTFTSGVESAVNWTGTSYDDYSVWSSSNPAYIPVPSGATYVRLSASLNVASTASGNRQIKIKDSNGNNYAGNCDSSDVGLPTNYISCTTGLIKISAAGNPTWFEVTFIQDSGSSVSLYSSTGNNFSLEVVK